MPLHHMPRQQEDSSFSEEKEAKRLFAFERAAVNHRAPKQTKVFCFFFSKKKNLRFSAPSC